LIGGIQVKGYVLIVGNHIEHLPLTGLRVIRGNSLIRVRIPPYAAATTPTIRSMTTPTDYAIYDDNALRPDNWNESKLYKDDEWKNISLTDDQTGSETTTSASQEDKRLPCSLFVASNAKINSTSIGLKEVHLTSLHGQYIVDDESFVVMTFAIGNEIKKQNSQTHSNFCSITENHFICCFT